MRILKEQAIVPKALKTPETGFRLNGTSEQDVCLGILVTSTASWRITNRLLLHAESTVKATLVQRWTRRRLGLQNVRICPYTELHSSDHKQKITAAETVPTKRTAGCTERYRNDYRTAHFNNNKSDLILKMKKEETQWKTGNHGPCKGTKGDAVKWETQRQLWRRTNGCEGKVIICNTRKWWTAWKDDDEECKW